MSAGVNGHICVYTRHFIEEIGGSDRVCLKDRQADLIATFVLIGPYLVKPNILM